jgi:hypothetical protein
VILLGANGTQVLVVRNGMFLAFPEVDLPRFQRVAPHLAAALRRDWGQEIVCLFSQATATRSEVAPGLRYYVAQAPRCQNASRGSSWVSVVSLDTSAFSDSNDYDTLSASLARCGREAATTPGPLEQLDWFPKLTAWIDKCIGPSGLHLTGPFRQLNASPTFSLIRFETNGSAVWFKAVGEPNVHELWISRYLAQFYPDFVPRILGICEEWNAWLTAEVQGTHLDENSDIDTWTAVTRTLAHLQIASIADTLHLIEAGCRDVRVSTLVDSVDPFLDVMAILMVQQTKESPARLGRKELAVLGSQLKDALSAYSNLDIRNTLGHLDLNPGNIIASRDHCTLLDWAEASVGPPFLTLQFLLERLRRLRPADESWERRLLSEYSAHWRSLVGPGEITEALAVAPLLAVYTYAAAADTWREAHRMDDPDIARHFRSLTRRIKREADLWSACRRSSVAFTA